MKVGARAAGLARGADANEGDSMAKGAFESGFFDRKLTYWLFADKQRGPGAHEEPECIRFGPGCVVRTNPLISRVMKRWDVAPKPAGPSPNRSAGLSVFCQPSAAVAHPPHTTSTHSLPIVGIRLFTF